MSLSDLGLSYCGKALLAMILWLWIPPVQAADEIELVLAADKAPAGVLFTIGGHDEEALQWVLPRVAEYVPRLRKKFPDLPIALLSQGDELFVLQGHYEKSYRDLHTQARRLAGTGKVSLYVDNTKAQWAGAMEEDFPGFVDATSSAAAIVYDYQLAGYRVIELAGPGIRSRTPSR